MKIFCSGIGGIGLSAYAAYQRASGQDVAGSDCSESALLADLRRQGIPISLSQNGGAVSPDVDLFVYTLALPSDHPEVLRAEQLGIPRKTYFEALGDLTRESAGKLITVCGTHGKSSTTAMAAKVLIEAGLDPSVILGTKTKDLGGRNWRVPSSPRRSRAPWLVEACEYHRSFLHLSPTIILLTNADGDHFDAFADLEDYQRAFQEFIARLPSDGVLITHCSDPSLQSLVRFAREKKIRVVNADSFAPPKLNVPGQHMRENAELVLALADMLGIDHRTAETSLAHYAGSWRRMEVKGETQAGVLVIDDYGHHPREVAATLSALKEAYPDRRIVCVFQPHTHDRTLKLYDAFTQSFQGADVVVIPNVYDARPQADAADVDVGKFVRDIAEASRVETHNGQSLDETVSLLKKKLLRPKDVLVTMGAGDIGKLADSLLRKNAQYFCV